MITEDYVNFEIAKLLKEKGFKGECLGVYFPNGRFNTFDTAFDYNLNDGNLSHAINAPTLQMAQKWFREEKHLAINPSTFYRKLEGHELHNWGCNIVNLNAWELYCSNPLETFPADTYEEALEKAMKYALEKFV